MDPRRRAAVRLRRSHIRARFRSGERLRSGDPLGCGAIAHSGRLEGLRLVRPLLLRAAMRAGGADEVLEERVAGKGLRLELRVELAAEEPRMVLELDDLDEFPIGRHAGEGEPGVPKRRQIFLIDLVPMAVPLGDRGLAIRTGREGAGGEL